MIRGPVRFSIILSITLALLGCRYFGFEEREPWRAEAEAQCLAGQSIQVSGFVEERAEIQGRGTCGMTRPLEIAALSQGFVELQPKATLACPIAANVERWFEESVQPAAFAWLGEPVVRVKQISAYSCRSMNGQPGASISEHAYGNALDISTFILASGREVQFKTGWKGRAEEQGFLRAVHAGACERFATVLAPGADAFHYDHIHVDLMRRASGQTICKPVPQTPMLPIAPRRVPEESVPVARAPVQPRPHSSSPWATSHAQPVGAPLVLTGQDLGNRAPPPGSFGTPLPLAERVRQSLGAPAPAAPPAPRHDRNPYGLVPPARVPHARVGAEATVTGSIASGGSASLFSPHSLAEQ
jgi:hypothetical protein